MRFGIIDWLIVVLYLIGVAIFGIISGEGKETLLTISLEQGKSLGLRFVLRLLQLKQAP
jgi:hypothetical protein